MKIQGKFYEITDLDGFVASYMANPAAPKAGTFKPFGRLRLHLATDFPLGFSHSLIPNASIKDDTDTSGAFSITVPAGFPPTAKAYLLALRQIATGPMGVPIYGPVYRSQTFALSTIKEQALKIYVARQKTPNNQGISQERISQEVSAFAKASKEVESASAFISSGGIDVTAKGKGATVKFEIALRPSSSHDLNAFIAHKVEDMDIDLPGPDWLTGLCVPEDEIEAAIKKGVKGVVKEFNAEIEPMVVKAVAAQAGVPEAVVANLFDTQISMTFEQIRYPVVSEKKVGGFTVKFRAVVPDACFGLPRKLF